MRSIAWILVWLPFSLMGQVADDFTDGDFINNPPWYGDTGSFEVNTARQLHLSAIGSDTACLATGLNPFQEMEWEFWIKLSFNTSLNNYTRVYLIADQPDLEVPLNGLFLQFGGSGDSIGFYRQTGSQHDLLYRFPCGSTGHSTNVFRIKVFYYINNAWLFMADSTGGRNFIPMGGINPSLTPTGNHFGLFCRFTSSNSTKVYFDDCYAGPLRRDTVPPVVKFAELPDSMTIRLLFSEAVTASSALDPDHYYLRRMMTNPVQLSFDPQEEGCVILKCPEPFPDGITDTLEVSGILDGEGNQMGDTLLGLAWYEVKPFDVLITEILADPDPGTGLPVSEFLELLNSSSFPVNLKNWRLIVGTSTKIFPSHNLLPGSRLIISSDSAYLSYGAALLLFTGQYALSNEGNELTLANEAGRVIHSVTYHADWYGDSYKKEGGWSLEMMDPENPCGCASNWAPSVAHLGGTPGSANSVAQSNPDITAPYLVRGAITGDDLLTLYFSEPVDSSTIINQNSWTIYPGIAEIESINPHSPGFTGADLKLNSGFEKGVVYHIAAPFRMKDCAGNPADTTLEVKVGIPDTITPGDVVINELLPNPYPGGVRFAELYNVSQKLLDVKEIVLEGNPVTQNTVLLFPGDYLCLSEDPDDILQRYPDPAPRQHLKVEKFPDLPESSGTIRISTLHDGTLLDQVDYSEEMHYGYLTDPEGVSLEKLDPGRLEFIRENWHSASFTSGFATPGKRNSTFLCSIGSSAVLDIQPALITPDNDGTDEVMTITISGMEPDTRCYLHIFDINGRQIKQLSNGETYGSSLNLIWDGRDDYLKPVPDGNYILRLVRLEISGKKQVIKRVVAVSSQH